jgi:hypothetical protein
LIKLITVVINLCFHLVLMLICFVKYSSVINLDLFWKQLFSCNLFLTLSIHSTNQKQHLAQQHSAVLPTVVMFSVSYYLFLD